MPRNGKSEPEILKLIKQDHDSARGLFKEFEQSIESSAKKAQGICENILMELDLHTELEEKIVYPELKKLDEDLFNEAAQEHHVAELLIKEIRESKLEAPVLKAKMLVLHEIVEHHMEEEEAEMFEQIRQIPQDRLQKMGSEWEKMKPRMLETMRSGGSK